MRALILSVLLAVTLAGCSIPGSPAQDMGTPVGGLYDTVLTTVTLPDGTTVECLISEASYDYDTTDCDWSTRK